MSKSLAVLGVPSSAGAYAPGQEMAPSAIRDAGLLSALRERVLLVDDLGDLTLTRWQPDKRNPHAMNVDAVIATALATAKQVRHASESHPLTLVLGGDCTIEIGVVAGCARPGMRTGLIYMDLDTDLNTPRSTKDGALDWMGVAHLLGIADCVDALTEIGESRPLMQPEDILLFGCRNITSFERDVIASREIMTVPFEALAENASTAVGQAVDWCRSFDRVLVHFDADIIDFADFPIAENTRRHRGMTFDFAMSALEGLMEAPTIAALTITEVNPFHCDAERKLIQIFAARLAEITAKARFSRG